MTIYSPSQHLPHFILRAFNMILQINGEVAIEADKEYRLWLTGNQRADDLFCHDLMQAYQHSGTIFTFMEAIYDDNLFFV